MGRRPLLRRFRRRPHARHRLRTGALRFGFWDWVGGRYSVDSAVGLTLAIVFGPARFEECLNGYPQNDENFANTPFEKKVVVLMGILNVWYRNFFKDASHAVMPYDQYLHRFPA